VELETVINEESPEPTVKEILSMSEEMRNSFFQVAGTEMIADLNSHFSQRCSQTGRS